MNRLTALAGVVALSVVACTGEPGTQPQLTSLPRELTAAETQLVAADNGFAFDLLHAALARDTATNLFLSPLSVSVALGMTLNGAAGTTADEMRTVLGFGGMPQADVNAAYHSLIELLGGLDGGVTWRLANSVWYRQGYPFNPRFIDTTRAYFDALVSPLDFSSPNAGATINQWVSNQTNGRIPSIVPDVLPSDAIMYLIDAIYFKGSWTTRFETADTHLADFHTATGPVTVSMMGAQHMPLRSASIPGYLVLELPYSRGAFAMTIVVPRDSAAIDSLAAHVTQADWNGWIDSLRRDTVAVRLPKFTVTYGTGLNDALRALGMPDAFCTSPSVDFTPLVLSGNACIDTVAHKTFVLVDEAGTEAAAATSVGMVPTAMPLPLAVDRPFLFAIRERFSGAIIFLGVIRNPATPIPLGG